MVGGTVEGGSGPSTFGCGGGRLEDEVNIHH